MWFATFLLLAGFSVTKGGEVYDVTTIYDVGSADFEEGKTASINGRTHARTNALGLPLCDRSSNCIVPKDAYKYNIMCDTFNGNCSWDTKDWTQTFVHTNVEERKPYKLTENPKLSFKNVPEYSDTNYLYFTTGASSIKNEGLFFVVRFDRQQYSGPQFFYGCQTNHRYVQYQFNVKDRDGTRVRVGCGTYHTYFSFDYSNDYLSFNFTKGDVKIYRGLSNPSLEIDLSTGPEYGEMKYFSMSGDNFALFKPSVSLKALSATREGSDLVSPSFSPDSSQLCLALVVYTPHDSRSDILHILAEDIYHSEHQLGTINSVKAGWTIKRANIILPKTISSPIKLIIRKVGSLPISIAWISSCSPDGEEVELLSPFYSSVYRPDLPVYTARSVVLDQFKNTQNDVNNIACVNGGVMTDTGCACFPGFSGQKCQFGCGRNRFGQDCKGLCSLHVQECKGLLLCTSHTECKCAPGYHGNKCNEECAPGRYGNDCSQQCGRCASGSPCDIYTGECFSCEPGYHPPYCKQASVYYSSKPELSTPDYGQIKVSFNSSDYVSASKPKLYQIQYREKDGPWRIYVNKILLGNRDSEEISETVEGLKVGVLYQVRVLLLDAKFNKYDGKLVQVSEILTKCVIPEEYDYKVKAESDSTSFSFSWTYVNNTAHWCPVVSYEVSWKEGWKWSSSEISQEYLSLTEFLPNSEIKFRVRANTSRGFAPFSQTILYSTQYNGTLAVWDLQVVSSTESSVALSWEPPRDSDDRPMQYTVTYKCVEQPACAPGCVNATEGKLTVDKTSATLSHLLPFAQYQVSVTPTDGLNATILAATSEVAPTEVPVVSAQKPVRTNTSLTVFWDPATVCSSFLLGYNYELVESSLGLKVLASGSTKATSVSFDNLTASTDFSVRVYVLTIAGWNPEAFLAIKTSTSATVPEAVRNLTVYKRGRNMLGVRWAAPRATYGTLKSFTVRHELGQEQSSHTVEPTPCVAWPDLYCHTIEALRASRRYNVTVSARNVDVPDDGLGASVTGVTKESPPTAPETLKLINSSSTSVGLQWHYPNLANGVLRSFLVSVEETEKYDQDSCCQVYPLIETGVKEEAQTYEAEVSGLHPASTYFVSVSAKTVGLGPSQSLVVYTRPPHLPLTVLPRLVLPSVGQEVSWLVQEQLPEVNNSDTFTSLIQSHLLLVVLNEVKTLQETVDSGISDPQLNSLLQEMISKPFYFVSEYTQDEEVIFSLSGEETDSSWGQPPSPPPSVEGRQFQLVAVQVAKYNDVFNADVRFSTPLTLR